MLKFFFIKKTVFQWWKPWLIVINDWHLLKYTACYRMGVTRAKIDTKKVNIDISI